MGEARGGPEAPRAFLLRSDDRSISTQCSLLAHAERGCGQESVEPPSGGTPIRMTSRDTAALQRLLDIMAQLLGPDGCPWDRAQTHSSLVPFLLEEAYELAEAIEHSAPNAGSPESETPQIAPLGSMLEELGDVLLQVVFHAGLAGKAGHFDFADVAEGLSAKLVSRHPHVFGSEPLDTADQVSEAWEQRKLSNRKSRMDGIPTALPALLQAQKVGARAARGGFEWERIEEIHAKVHEELEEFQSALKAAHEQGDKAEAEMEFGDLLFALVQLARWSGVDAETALRKSTRKFGERFRHMEHALSDAGLDPKTVDISDWWTLWKQAKQKTRLF
jgi:tetrapyrrole methylase family protein/MazG family protein